MSALRLPSLRLGRLTLLPVLCLALAGPAARAACTGPADMETAVETHPSADTWAQLGNWFGQQGDFACAASAFQSAVQLEPDSAQLNFLLGLADFESQNLPQAVSALEASIRDDGSELKPHLLLATIYMRQGDPKDAAPEWSAALTMDPSNAMALHGLSRCRVALGDFTGEIQLLQKASLDASLSVDLAAAYMGLGRYDDVIDTLRSAASTADPQSAGAHALLAWALLMEDQAAAALPEARTAASENATLPLAQIALGRALIDTGDPAAALPVLAAALRLDASSLEAHLELARAYGATGHGPEARRERLLCLQMMAAPLPSGAAPQQEAMPAQ